MTVKCHKNIRTSNFYWHIFNVFSFYVELYTYSRASRNIYHELELNPIVSNFRRAFNAYAFYSRNIQVSI